MASLKEIFEKAQQTGKVEYTYFGGTHVSSFNQTSIPFGDDVDYGAGTSRRPYIRLGYDPAVKYRTDDPTNTYNTLLATGRDVERITRFFTDVGPGSAAQGALWLGKQVGLQISNPDMAYDPDKKQLDGPRIYNPLGTNTLASVGGNALGLHFTRHGLSPLNDQGYITLNTVTTGAQFFNGGSRATTNEFLSRLNKYKATIVKENPFNQSITLADYGGGPNSVFGIGRTKITTYNDSFRLNTGVTNKNPDSGLAQNLGFKPWSYQDIEGWGQTNTKNKLTPTSGLNTAAYPKDFREKYDKKNAENYPKLNVHERIGVTTPSNRDSRIGPNASVDSINVISITPRSVFYGLSNTAMLKTSVAKSPNGSNPIYSGLYDTAEVQGNTNGYFGRDIIKFRIELLNNDKPIFEGTVNTDVLAFRAYLGDLTDDITPQWKPFNYMGRGEDFFVYEKFSRKINFSFFIFAHSKYEMPAIYTKLNYLISSMAPDYNIYNQMRGTYAYLTIGDYVYQQPGVFTSMNISSLLDAPWEITLKEPNIRENINDTRDKYQHEVPKYMKVTMTFNPIHNFLPKKNHRDQPHTSTFITPNWRVKHPNYYLPQTQVTLPDGTQKSTLINIPAEDIK